VNKIHVVGIGFRPLDKRTAEVVRGADVVLANSRLLDVFKSYSEYGDVRDKIIVHPGVYETLDYIRDNYKEKCLALLAAGDPMFFGIGRLVIERFGQETAEIYPDLSSVQVAFSRVKETSNNALLISLHGGPDPAKRRKLEYEITDLPAILKRHGKLAVLTDKVSSPEKIAEVLEQHSAFRGQQSAVKIYVCEKLGYDDEKVTEGTPEKIAGMSFEHPNVVIITSVKEQKSKSAVGARCPRPSVENPEIVFGLRESEIKHSKGLITKDEVRAVTIHKLRLPQSGVFWDIGAGSGSVSIEVARLCPDLSVYAVEKNDELIDIVHENKKTFHTMNIEVLGGEAADILNDLPVPERVFVGGSGGSLSDIVNIVSEKMLSGIVVINATTIETLNEAVQSLEKSGFDVHISEVSISRSKVIGQKRHMSALNPIFIVTGEKSL
jgi:precorrin-6Y C5,15-methyltransferase (decarboxylating)